MKIANLILGILMALAMLVQLNDPDPWAWVALYGLTAALCALAAFGKTNGYILGFGLLAILAWAFTLYPSFAEWIAQGTPSIGDKMKASHPYIEEVREFLGLALCGIIVIFLLIQHRLKRA